MDKFQKHIVTGKIQLIGSDYLQLKLSNNKGQGRLPYENIIDPPLPGSFDKYFSKGQTLTVFLEQNDHNDPLWWRLNQRWVNDNPWYDLSIGETVYGIVSSYYHNTAAFIRLEDKGRMSGFLHISETIHGAVAIQEVLEVGDHIYAEIIDIDDEKLHVSLSIKSLLEQKKYKEDSHSHEDLLLKQIAHDFVSSPNLKDVYWLIIEDDDTLFGRFKHWAEEFGCNVKRAKNLQHLEQILKKGYITHASVDANLNNYKQDIDSKDYLRIIKRHYSIQTVVISGNDQSRKLADQFSVPFIFKPVSEALLLHWLQNQKKELQYLFQQKDASWEDEAIYWQAEGLECEIKKQGQSELERFVKEKNCVAAFIALKLREGVIQIRVHDGLINSGLEKAQYYLMHTLVNNILETGIPEIRDRATFGDLTHLLPQEATHAYGFPFTATNGKYKRVAVFFRDTAFSADEQKELMHIAPFLESLSEKLSLLQAWDEDRVFANLGRFSSAVMHELRNNIDLLKTPIKKLKKITTEEKINIDILRQQMHSLEQRYSKIEQLLKGNLNLIQKYRHGQFSIDNVIKKLVKFYQYEYADKKNSCLIIEGNLPKIRIDFPVLAFEQSLINILQNALYHIKKNKGHVTVRVLEGQPNKNGHSIFIDIADNGLGISASMKDQLFKPRETAKGSKGTGMGLYISRKLLQAHGGDLVLAKSIRYFGTCFRIALPREFDDRS